MLLASEFIQKIQHLITEHGDLPIQTSRTNDYYPSRSVRSGFIGIGSYNKDGNACGERSKITLHVE